MKSLKKFAFFTAASTFFLHVANKVIFLLALVKELLPTKDGSFYEWKFGKAFYTKEGDGSPLILIHDLQAESSGYEWSRVRQKLAKSHTVYTLDLPGCGRSDKPRVTYTNFMYVQFLEGFFREIIASPAEVAVCGASSSFVLHFAAQNPALVKKILMINPPSFGELSTFPTPKTKLYKKLVAVPVFGTCIYNHGVSLQRICEKFHQEYFYDGRECAAKYINAYYESAHINGSDSKYLFASVAAGYTNMPVSHILDRLSMPVEILAGEEKSGIAAAVKDYKDIQPQIIVKKAVRTKQLPHLEDPEQTVKLMQDFLG